MSYFVLNADIKNSRKQHFNKNDFREKIDYLNEEFKQDLIVSFTMIKGDEIQGLLKPNAQIFKLIRLVKYSFLPYDIRIGIGYGTIYDEEELTWATSSWELNGEAFFNARDAMDEMKEGKGKKQFAYNVYFKTNSSLLDQRINHFYSYVDDQLSKWKEEIWDIILLEELAYKHEEIAKEMIDKTKQTESELKSQIKKERVNITRKIQRSNWYKIKETEVLLDHMLKEGIS